MGEAPNDVEIGSFVSPALLCSGKIWFEEDGLEGGTMNGGDFVVILD